MPKISFLIATKNRADLINETLDSLINQTEKDWEAIIVDDHGNDNTEEIIRNYKDLRFRYFYLNDAHGKGASCARNFACMQAKSQLLAIMDSDDIAYPKRAEISISAFETDPDLDIFYSNFDIWKPATGEIKDRNFPVYEYSIEKIKEINFIPHSTVVIKRQVLLDNPYNQYFKIAEDYDLFTRLAIKEYKFSSTNEKLLKYRMHEGISTEGNKLSLMKNYLILVKMARGWQEFDSDILRIIESLEKDLRK